MKKIKKALSAFILIALFCGLSSTVLAYSWGEFANDWLSGGRSGYSFTQYEGEFAQLTTEGFDTALTSSTDVKEFVIRIVNFALGFLGLLAIIMVIYGGIRYVTAGGEEEGTQKGKKAITYAAIGLLIVMGSFAFVNTVISGAGGTDSSTGTSQNLTGAGFNSSAGQVRALAMEIFNGFAFLAQSTEETIGIKSDALKASLVPDSLPAKDVVLAFLQGVKTKAMNMESRVQPFTTAEAQLNQFIRKVDADIDHINSLRTIEYVKILGAGAEQSCVESAALKQLGFEEVAMNQQDLQTRPQICQRAGYQRYVEGLYSAWYEMQAEYSAENTTLYSAFIDPIAAAYKTDLERIFLDLDSIYTESYSFLKGTQGAANDAEQAYTTMKAAYANLLTEVGTWATYNLASSATDNRIDKAGAYMTQGLDAQYEFYEALSELAFVQAHLTANVIQGSAPLTVIFNTLGTVDPAGGSIQGANISWDLAGTLATTELAQIAPGEMIVPTDGSVTCTFMPTTEEEQQFIGQTAKRCTYNIPGTYTAAVKITSNEPTLYAPGISILTIRVQPPTTKIELTMTTATGEEEIIMHYEDDVLVVDKREVTITLNEAEEVTFDASDTDAAQYKWIFGNGDTEEFPASATVETGYDETGNYEVTLEVLNQLGVTDRKLFILKVAGVAARLTASSATGAFINTPVIFDASGSRSDLGNIRNYEWIIEPSPGQNLPAGITEYPVTESGAGMTTFTHSFLYPLNYDISVEVTDDQGVSDTASLTNYRVESQLPEALIDYEIPNESQPGTVHLSAERSYDPDGDVDLIYEWSIEPASDSENWVWVSANAETISEPAVKFKQEGDYDVTLKVTDPVATNEYDEITETITIENTLDIAWAENQEVTAMLDENGQAEMNFNIISDNAVAYEIDFDDGNISSGEISGTKSIPHTYTQAGRYAVEATVYDEDDNDNSITKRIFIGGETPIARIEVAVNGVEISNLSEVLEVTKTDILTFDASESRNTNGTGRNLRYSWNLGDTEISSSRAATHSYDELSPIDPGYYIVKLTVYNENDVSSYGEDEVHVSVVNQPPTFSSVSAIPSTASADLITPVTVNMRVYGADDEDGNIVQYKWWYFDIDDPDELLGIQVTEVAATNLTIGTSGQQGREMTYGFGLEVTDTDNLTASSTDLLQPAQIPTIIVTNGPNELPTADFTVDATSVFTGDQITFTSSSQDPDGQIVSYIWDLEGDGFYNNVPTEESILEYAYTAKNLQGYQVRLKVVDDKGGEAVSELKRIYVDSLAETPEAAFVFEVVGGSAGKKVQFTNNSTADANAGAEIMSNEWDFDIESALTSADSDGDGVKNNDVDSQASNPQRLYTEYGTYTIKLKVTDNQGNFDEVSRTLTIPMADPPTAAFTYDVAVNGMVTFTSNSTADTEKGAVITGYEWDFDTMSQLISADSDGDGEKDNDVDSELELPVHQYDQLGVYQVKLTIIDDQGGTDFVVNPVDTTAAGAITIPTGQQTTPTGQLSPALITSPTPGLDNKVHLQGDSSTVTFDFSQSQGAIAYYILDKNIYFDTDGDGIKNNDQDFKTSLPGTWRTNFERAWGTISAKLTVTDIYGNENSTTQEIQFD